MTGEVHLVLVSEGLAVMTDAVAGAARDRRGGQSGGAGASRKTTREMKAVVWCAVVKEEDQRTLPAAAEEGWQAKQATEGRKQWHGSCCGRHRNT